MLRLETDRPDVDAAVGELRRSSLIEVEQEFLSVPLVASVFGRRKLSASPMKAAVESNLSFLQMFGPGQKIDVRHGLEPRIQRFFQNVANKVTGKPEDLV